MVHSQLAIDTAKVKISKAIKHDDERRALELNLGSKEKLYLSQRTLDGIELMLTIQERRSIEVPGYINVNKFEGKNIYLLDEIEIPTILKIKSESDNEEQISCTLGFFQYLFTSLYGGKIPDNLSLQGIENFVLGSIDQESQEKLDISYKFSNCNSLGDYIISNANHFAISTRDNIFSNFFSHDFLNKVPIHTHPQLESRLNDNRYPSEEIVFLEETNFFVSQNGGKTRLPFQLIATTYDSKKWITAYSLDDEENYHISIFQI
jgi:hypothetical protein